MSLLGKGIRFWSLGSSVGDNLIVASSKLMSSALEMYSGENYADIFLIVSEPLKQDMVSCGVLAFMKIQLMQPWRPSIILIYDFNITK